MSEVMDRLKTGEYASNKRNRYAKYWLGGGLAIAVYAAISATFNVDAQPGDIASILPFYIPIFIGFFLSPFARDIFTSNAAQAKYDEFEVNALNIALGHAYSYLVFLVLALVLWLWLGTSFDFDIPKRPYDWSAIFMSFLAIGTALRAFFAECLIPMPPAEDSDADEDA